MDTVSGENLRLDRAAEIISTAAKWSAGAGLIPIPLLDVAALGVIQVRMVRDIGKLYNQSFRDTPIKGTVTVLLGTLLPTAGTSIVASGIKAMPGVGTLLGIAAFPALGSAATYAMGRVIVRHFEQGGTAAEFTADRVKADLHNEFSGAKPT